MAVGVCEQEVYDLCGSGGHLSDISPSCYSYLLLCFIKPIISAVTIIYIYIYILNKGAAKSSSRHAA